MGHRISDVDPDPPANVPSYADCHVDPSELLTEHDTGLTSTGKHLDLGEGEEGEGGEEEEGGMVGDDLEGVLTAQVEGGEDGQETLRGEQEEYRQEMVKRSDVINLIMNQLELFKCKL